MEGLIDGRMVQVREGVYELSDEMTGESLVYNVKDLNFMIRVVKGVDVDTAYLEIFEEIASHEEVKIYVNSSRMKRLKQEILKHNGIDIGLLNEIGFDILTKSQDEKARVKVWEVELRRKGMLGSGVNKKDDRRVLSDEERKKIDYLFGRETQTIDAKVVEADGKPVKLVDKGVVEGVGDDIFGDIPY